MASLEVQFSPSFKRDLKRLDKKHVDTEPLAEVIDLIILNTPEALEVLRNRHNMHFLAGNWKGCNECHVCNVGDWLLIWQVSNNIALLERTGSHDELFR